MIMVERFFLKEIESNVILYRRLLLFFYRKMWNDYVIQFIINNLFVKKISNLVVTF